VIHLAGEQAFSPDAWCPDCQYYKARRVAVTSWPRVRRSGVAPDVLGFGASQTKQYFTGHAKSDESDD